MSSVSIEITIILLLILANGVLAMAELAIVSARKNRLEERAEEGSRGAQAALELANNPGRFLSTIQIGITLIGILTGAFGGATLARELARLIAGIAPLAPYSEGISMALVVIGITYLSLVLGELAPKRLALNNAESMAVGIAPLMHGLSRLTAPLAHLLNRSTDLLLRIGGVRPSSEPEVTTEDVQSMMAKGAQIGVFADAEQEIIAHVFRLGDRAVTAVMTPRTEISFLDIDDTLDEMCAQVFEDGYSRYPVYQHTQDNVIGFLHVRDLFCVRFQGAPVKVRDLLQPALFIPVSKTALQALEQMREIGVETALILDEYGGVLGLVSIHDILEGLVGAVDQPLNGPDPEFTPREDGSYLVDGRILIDELKDYLDIATLPGDEMGYYETLGGMMMTVLGRIPSAGDIYEYDHLSFEVMDMDGLRVDKVLVMEKKDA